jgi:microcystin-dependent protein
MAYEIKFTDEINKGRIIVEDREINNTDTSLSFPGRGSTAYGQAVGENFLHLLENFASVTPPDNPVEGQLWYDTTVGVDQLKIYDGTNWVSSSGLKKAASAPLVSESVVGDLWADTDNQQLYLNSGAGWILVGPEFSQGLASGARAEQITGTDDKTYTILLLELNDIPIVILSANQFTPKSTITGFTSISPGVNLTTRNISDGISKYRGIVESAENLRIGNDDISALNFLRGDVTSTSNSLFRVRNNQGIQIGDNGQMSLEANGDIAVLKSNFTGASLDLSVKQGSQYNTAIRVKSDTNVGINKLNPQESLDVGGNIRANGTIFVTDTEDTTSLNTGAIQLSGGAAISKKLLVGDNATIQGNLTVAGAISGNGSDIGNFGKVTATKFVGNLEGSVVGTIQGSASSASKLINSTRFEITGDITAPAVTFDGSGSLTKTFDTTISSEFITTKTNITTPQNGDEILINRTTGDPGLYKISQRNFLKNIPTNPIGMITPYGGNDAPLGWFLCDGREIEKTQAFDLWLTIGHKFKDPSAMTNSSATHFGLPDFRGRFALGADNMGGSSANRVTESAADSVGSFSGSQDTDIRKQNLPEHDHDLRSSGSGNGTVKQFYAIRDAAGSSSDSPEVSSLNIQTGASSTTGIPSSGGIRNGGVDGSGNYRSVNNEDLGEPIDVMNPFLTINYIIYAGDV